MLASYPWFIAGFWIFAFEILLLMAYIDLRLQIIPDELTIILGAAAIFEAIFSVAYPGSLGQPWGVRFEGALFGAALFGFLALITRGKGMGMGDVKLAIPLGLLFGWPDIALLSASAFVAGAFVGIVLLLAGRKTMKSAVPFAPFLIFGATFVFFFGTPALGWYIRIIGL
jgi:prepilin signal peptidase PulO-like enzyme (type II secretory pathway)